MSYSRPFLSDHILPHPTLALELISQSKYRHVYGEKAKTHYENVKISGSAWDTDVVSAGGKYVSVNWQASGGGVSTRIFILVEEELMNRHSVFYLPSPPTLLLHLLDSLPNCRISFLWLGVILGQYWILPGHLLTITS
jgi:hypothetical protein